MLAWNALSRWSEVATRFPIPLGHNHERKVRNLLFAVADQPPVVHGNQMVPQARLIPLAVERLMQSDAIFTSVAYACRCVQNLLDEWAKQGMREAPAKVTDNGRPNPVESAAPAYAAMRKAEQEAGHREVARILAEQTKARKE